jgi:replicative DNA helicase
MEDNIGLVGDWSQGFAADWDNPPQYNPTDSGIYPPAGINPYTGVVTPVPVPVPVTPTPPTSDPLTDISINIIDCLTAYALRPPGLKLPWRELQKLTEIDNGSITTFIAGTSHGKTAVALQLLLHYLQQDKKVLFFSGEMDKSVLVMRLLSIIAGLSLAKTTDEYRNILGSQPAFPAVIKAYRELERLQDLIYITPVNSRDADLIKYADAVKPDIIFVDYIQQLRPANKNGRTRDEEIEAVMDTLNSYAISTQIPILLFAQINREARNTDKPSLTCIRHSATIEQYSANVYGIWNASMARRQGSIPGIPSDGWYWSDDSKATEEAIAYADKAEASLLEILILKSRYHGNVCKSVPLLFNGLTGSIRDFPTALSAVKTI